MVAATHSHALSMSMLLGIGLFRPHPRQRIDNFVFDSYYSTSWKSIYFIVVEYIEFLRYEKGLSCKLRLVRENDSILKNKSVPSTNI